MDNYIGIYSPSGQLVYEAPMSKEDRIVDQLMGEHYIEIVFKSTERKVFIAGSYMVHDGWQYFLKKDAYPEPLSNADGCKYCLKFYAQQHRMEHCLMKWLAADNKEVTFKLTATLDDFAQLLVDNMTAYQPAFITGYSWTYDKTNNSDTREVSFDGVSCWDAMTLIADAFGVEYWATYVKGNKSNELHINFGKLSVGSTWEEIREGEVVNQFPATKRGDDSNFGTRYYIYGGAKNIPDDYYDNIVGGTTNHISEKHLHLPDGKQYIDILNGEVVDTLPLGRVVERVITLDDVFPKNTSIVTGAEMLEEEVIEGRKDSTFTIISDNTGFTGDDDEVLDTLGVTFTSGALSGSSFEVHCNKPFDNRFYILPKVEGTSGSEQLIIPNQYLKPNIGDTFVLTGIRLPESKVKEAEQELLSKGVAKVKEYSTDTNVYDCKTNAPYCTNNNINYALGTKVKLLGGAFGESGRLSRVQGYEKKLYNEYDAVYSIGDNNTYSNYRYLLNRIVSVTDSEAKLEAAQGVLDSRIKREKINLNKINENKADKNDLNGLASEVYVDTQIKPIADDRLQYKRELDSVTSDFEAIHKAFQNFIAQYEALLDANGESLRYVNGVELHALVPYNAYQSFVIACNEYEQQITAVTLSIGVPQITDDYIRSQVNYYNAKALLQQAISDKTHDDIEDVSYLTDVFGEDNIDDAKAVTLGSLIGVKNANSAVVAGMYGGGVQALNENGFKDAEHGALMMFAGATSVNNVGNAKHRVYEDGTVYTKEGVFEGLVKHRVVTITKSNLNSMLPQTGGTIDGYSRYTLPPTLMSAIMNIKAHGNITKPDFKESDSITFALPTLYNYSMYGVDSIATADDLRGLAGAKFIIYNNSPALVHFCGKRYYPDTGAFNTEDVCYDDWVIHEGYFAVAECKIDFDVINREVIYWDIKIGTHTVPTMPINE